MYDTHTKYHGECAQLPLLLIYMPSTNQLHSNIATLCSCSLQRYYTADLISGTCNSASCDMSLLSVACVSHKLHARKIPGPR